MSGRCYKLTDELKAQVVERLARYESPVAIARSLKQDHDIDITRQSVAFYDPTLYSSRACPEKWATLFRETRARLLEGKAEIGFASRIARLIALDRMARDEIGTGNTREARALLQQIATEAGVNFTNRQRRAHMGPGGGLTEIKPLSDRDRARAIAALINKVRAAQSNNSGNAP